MNPDLRRFTHYIYFYRIRKTVSRTPGKNQESPSIVIGLLSYPTLAEIQRAYSSKKWRKCRIIVIT